MAAGGGRVRTAAAQSPGVTLARRTYAAFLALPPNTRYVTNKSTNEPACALYREPYRVLNYLEVFIFENLIVLAVHQ